MNSGMLFGIVMFLILLEFYNVFEFIKVINNVMSDDVFKVI